MTETRFYEPGRLNTPPKPLFLLPLLSKVFPLSKLFTATDEAQRQLKKGGKFEDLSAGECRPSALAERYDNLYTQTRLDAMNELDELESLDKVDEVEISKTKYCSRFWW